MLKNMLTISKQPYILVEYLSWIFCKRNSNGRKQKQIRDSISISGFSRFSEFRAVDDFITAAEYEFFSKYNYSEGHILDIGSNMGVLSIFFAQKLPDKIIYSIEANKHTYEDLKINVAENLVDNVETHHLAICEKVGEVLFSHNPIQRGTASLLSNGDGYEETVPCTTLDSFIEQNSISQISLMKVDVEGFETLVFRGGKNALENKLIKAIYFEVFPDCAIKAGFEPSEAAVILLDAGYLLYRINFDGTLVATDLGTLERIGSENWIAILPVNA